MKTIRKDEKLSRQDIIVIVCIMATFLLVMTLLMSYAFGGFNIFVSYLVGELKSLYNNVINLF